MPHAPAGWHFDRTQPSAPALTINSAPTATVLWVAHVRRSMPTSWMGSLSMRTDDDTDNDPSEDGDKAGDPDGNACTDEDSDEDDAAAGSNTEL